MTKEIHTKVLNIGSGPAGYTAAIYAARACLDPVLVQGLQPGGQMTITTDVENYPGFADVIQGPWLMEQMSAQAEQVGTRMISDIIVSVDLSQRPFIAVGDSGTQYIADSLIITTGAQAKWLGLPSEDMFQGVGVSACATCDGFFYREKEVIVVGGHGHRGRSGRRRRPHAVPGQPAVRGDPLGPDHFRDRRSRADCGCRDRLVAAGATSGPGRSCGSAEVGVAGAALVLE